MSKHTPGPWWTKREGFSAIYVLANIGGGWIQEVAACGPTVEGQEQQEANARLIAAAPELLESLKRIMSGISNMERDEKYEQARAAIAAAEGN